MHSRVSQDSQCVVLQVLLDLLVAQGPWTSFPSWNKGRAERRASLASDCQEFQDLQEREAGQENPVSMVRRYLPVNFVSFQLFSPSLPCILQTYIDGTVLLIRD